MLEAANRIRFDPLSDDILYVTSGYLSLQGQRDQNRRTPGSVVRLPPMIGPH